MNKYFVTRKCEHIGDTSITSVKPLVGLSIPSGTNNFDPKLLIPPSNFKAEKCTQHGGRL
jgi:hypothetical protein